MSASPRVPISEKQRSRCPSAKSSQAAANSRLSDARRSSSRRRQAGSTFRNVYLTKCRTGMPLPMISDRNSDESPGYRGKMKRDADRPGVALLLDVSGRGDEAHRGARRALHRRRSHVRVLAPFDPPDTFAAVLHRGARPQTLEPPDYLVSLGRTVGFKANGAVSNLTITSARRRDPAQRAAHRRLRRGAHPRAGRAAGRLGRDRLDAAAARRDVPLLLREPLRQRASPTCSARAGC